MPDFRNMNRPTPIIRAVCLSLLLIQTGLLRLQAESEWRPWVEKINARLVDTLTPQQQSHWGKPPVKTSDGKNAWVESIERQVVVSDTTTELWSRIALAIGRDASCPGYLTEFLRRCADAPNGMAALPDPSELPSKKAKKMIADDRNQQLTAFSQLAATLISAELVRPSIIPQDGASKDAARLTDAQAREVLLEGTRLAARSGYTSEALQSLLTALPAGAPSPVWVNAFLPAQTRGAALAKEIKKVERKATGR